MRQQPNTQQNSNANITTNSPHAGVSLVSLTAGTQQMNQMGSQMTTKAALARNPSPIRSRKVSIQQQNGANGEQRGQRDSPARRYQNQNSGTDQFNWKEQNGNGTGSKTGGNLHVHGQNKLLQNRSQNAVDMNEVIQFRLKQHHNEGTQANFESFSNYGNVTRDPLMSSTMKPSHHSPSPHQHAGSKEGSPLLVDEQQNMSPQYEHHMTKQKKAAKKKLTDVNQMVESRSSLIIPVTSSQHNKNQEENDQIQQLGQRNSADDHASCESSPSLPYNTDINVEKIQIRQSKDGTSSPKTMRKAATNANMLHLSFKQSNEELIHRKQQSMLLHQAKGGSPNHRNSGKISPVIITSLDKSPRQPAKSIVFDVRSETPKSQRLHNENSKIEGGSVEKPEDVKTRNISNYYDTDNAVSPNQPDQESQQPAEGQLLKPIKPNATNIQVNTVGEPVITPFNQNATSPSKDKNGNKQNLLTQSVRSSSNYRGLNTMSISLFEESLFKNNQNQVSPFRQSNQPKGQNPAKLMASLEQVANEDEVIRNTVAIQAAATQNTNTVGTSIDELTMQAVAAAKSTTSVEQAASGQTGGDTNENVQSSPTTLKYLQNEQQVDQAMKYLFRQAIKEHEDKNKKKWRNMTPYERSKVLETFVRLQREMRDSSFSQKVLDSRDAQRMQQDLSMCISVGTVKAGPNPHVKKAEKILGFNQDSNLKFDDKTLRDHNQIIQKIVKIKTQETIEDAQNISSQRDIEIMPPPNSGSKSNVQLRNEVFSMTEAQMLQELEHVRQQKEDLLKEHPGLLVNNNQNASYQQKEQIYINPQKSVLHMRYPFNSDISLVESQTHLQPLMSGMELSKQLSVTSLNNAATKSPDQQSTALGNVSDNKNATPDQLAHFIKIKTTVARNQNNANNSQGQQQQDEFPEMPPFELQTKGLIQTIPGDVLPSVPEEQHTLHYTRDSLAEQIKETLKSTDSEQMYNAAIAAAALASSSHSSHRQHAHHHQYNIQPQQVIPIQSMTKSQEDLLEMTQLSLQAISLTKKHQMAQTQAVQMNNDGRVTNQNQDETHNYSLDDSPQKRHIHVKASNMGTNGYPRATVTTTNMSPLVKKPTTLTEVQGRQTHKEQNLPSHQRRSQLDQQRNNEQELKESITDLKPIVQPQQLNKPKVAPTAKAQVIRRDTNELDNLSKFVEDNTAKGENQELQILENRLRDHQNAGAGIHKVDSSYGISDRPSQLTNIKEPRLIQNFNQKARELELMILEQSNTHTTSGEIEIQKRNQQLWDKNVNVLQKSHNTSANAAVSDYPHKASSSGVVKEQSSTRRNNTGHNNNNKRQKAAQQSSPAQSQVMMRMTQQALLQQQIQQSSCNSIGMIVGKRMEQQPSRHQNHQAAALVQTGVDASRSSKHSPAKQTYAVVGNDQTTAPSGAMQQLPSRVQIVDLTTAKSPQQNINTDSIQLNGQKEQMGLSSQYHKSQIQDEKQSIGTHKLQEESTGQVFNYAGNPGLAGAALNHQIHVGASYTFYNEQSKNSPQLNQEVSGLQDQARAKASSQLENYLKSRPVQERDNESSAVIYHQQVESQNEDYQEAVAILSSEEHKTTTAVPALISTETPIKL